MKRQTPKPMKHIGSILGTSLNAYRKGADSEMTKIWELWDATVGDAVSRNARPSAFKGHLLVIEVSSSSWLHHLGFLKQDLISKINTALGKELVRELKFKIGNL